MARPDVSKKQFKASDSSDQMSLSETHCANSFVNSLLEVKKTWHFITTVKTSFSAPPWLSARTLSHTELLFHRPWQASAPSQLWRIWLQKPSSWTWWSSGCSWWTSNAWWLQGEEFKVTDCTGHDGSNPNNKTPARAIRNYFAMFLKEEEINKQTIHK